jgi:hypothetical protein
MQSITSIERLVLESLAISSKDLKALMLDTHLELRFLANILHALTLRGLVVLSAEGYAINRHIPQKEIDEVNCTEARHLEAKELLEGLCHAQGKCVGVRKAWVSEKDRAILRALLKNLEDFMKTLPEAPKNAPLHEYTLVVFGEDRYGSVIQRLIGGVA